MNVPNMITLCRFILIPLYLLLFFSDIPNRMYWSFGVLLLAGLTDVVDGYLARRSRQVTQLGSMLDPLVDKLMVLAVFLSLLLTQRVGFVATAAVFIRDLGMIVTTAFFHFQRKATISANLMGKMTTVLYYIALFLLIFDQPGAEMFLWGVIVFSFLTSFVYLFQFKLLNQKWM
ncbi:CDP-alcohol phosphatidyltransferase family protein [Desmospora activa]|uniref:Phosphatidylglycerophosphate synthase n=1 Tax=Desmospora activa DSM 45169 TaxID=1121389 RepID=A0A2T4Z4C3_9BACL|nr:CDP-alcohol phosphatidyltransferase family protein [Desmospora activa]PTM56730.1 cardiolipin synthase [Desmospora activa DSM 45169]